MDMLRVMPGAICYVRVSYMLRVAKVFNVTGVTVNELLAKIHCHLDVLGTTRIYKVYQVHG